MELEFKLGGYFPKHVVPRPEWVHAPDVLEICSVSNCVSDGPEGWVDRWLHNELAWYESPELALQVIPPSALATARIFGYALLDIRCVAGTEETWTWPPVAPIALPPTFRSIGFDAVSKSMESMLSFECSPLSCNDLASEWGANAHCLLTTAAEALLAARQFALEQPEPGAYYVVEVFEPV
jgi:hypothetical protein